MGGKSKSATVGYRYFMGLHIGVCLTADALLEIRGGDRRAWIGEVTDNQVIEIDAPNLYGGEQREGGIRGAVSVMFGRDDQVPNDYLGSQHGSPNPAYRGFMGLVFHGPSDGDVTFTIPFWRYKISVTVFRSGYLSSLNPYVKPWAIRVRSIKAGWDGGTCWYESKAAIQLTPDSETVTTSGAIRVPAGAYYTLQQTLSVNYGEVTEAYIADADTIGRNAIAARNAATGSAFVFAGSQLTTLFIGGTNVPAIVAWAESHGPTVGIAAVQVEPVCPSGYTASFVEGADTTTVGLDAPVVACSLAVGGHQGMNPAHIIYQALTDPDWGMGYPPATIDEASFMAAADQLHAEGFGLCMKWSTQTTIQEFTQIVADHAGLVYGQDRRTGLFRMRLLRADYDVESLPVFTKAMVRVVKAQRPSLADTVNEIQVTYTDLETGKETTSPPLQNLANIQAQGRVVSQTLSFAGLPTHGLATRVGMRELAARSVPLWRFSLEFKRHAFDLDVGEPFVLDLRDTEWGVLVVCRAGILDFGNAADGLIRAEVVEDVFGLPDASYVADPGPGTPPADPAPVPAEATAFEIPYRELARAMTAAELDALPAAAGYLGVAAIKPTNSSMNYAIVAAVPPAEPELAGTGDFTPGALLAAAAAAEYGPTVLAIESPSLLPLLQVGTAAFLGEGAGAEQVRIDAVDATAMTVTVGRGCGDTTPKAWPAGTRLWGFGSEMGVDPTEYADGDVVELRALPRTPGGELGYDLADALPVTLDARAERPYPPGLLAVNGEAYPSFASASLVFTWAHRDRVLQADDLVDTSEASIGPEAGTTYTVTVEMPVGTVVHTEAGIAGTASAPHNLGADGVARVRVTAHRDGLASWQALEHTFTYYTGVVSTRVAPGANRRVTPGGNVRITRG